MDKNIVDDFMYYLFNQWNKEESVRIYGENLGTHIYNKWCAYREQGADQLEWYANLDMFCRRKLVERAIEFYDK